MNLRTVFVAALAALALTDAAPVSCGGQGGRPRPPQNSNAGVKPTPMPTPAEVSDMKVLAEGFYGKVEEPFLVVARSREVYAALRSLAEGLPDLGDEFFESGVVVAGFLGTRNSGGYAVEITREGGGPVVVSEREPPKGSMTTMALTQPYKVVSVPLGESRLEVEARGRWAGSLMRPYKVEAGEMEVSGGIAGRTASYGLEGSLSAARREGLVTLAFDLRGAGAMRERVMKTVASGVVRGGGDFEMTNVDPGNLVEHPRSPVRVTGKLAGDRLTLDFETQPINIPDSFTGRGRLEAAAQGKP